ncbi:hypothetical protein CFOL_v3_23782, partial [Cephalotus follicularis]
KTPVRSYVIFNGYNVRFRQNQKWKVVCTYHDGSPWRMYASSSSNRPDDSTMVVRTLFNEHNCSRPSRNKNVKSHWLDKHYVDKVRICPKWKLGIVLKDLITEVSRSTTYRTRKKANDDIEGSNT